jgi:DNA-binding response OmpR family regulator
MYNGRILILDDDIDVGNIVKRIAESANLEARLCSNPTAFLSEIDVWNPTHVAIDLVLPDMDGDDLIVAIANRRCTAQIIIVSGMGTSALNAASHLAAACGLTVAGILAKPFSPAALRLMLVDSSTRPPETS